MSESAPRVSRFLLPGGINRSPARAPLGLHKEERSGVRATPSASLFVCAVFGASSSHVLTYAGRTASILAPTLNFVCPVMRRGSINSKIPSMPLNLKMQVNTDWNMIIALADVRGVNLACPSDSMERCPSQQPEIDILYIRLRSRIIHVVV